MKRNPILNALAPESLLAFLLLLIMGCQDTEVPQNPAHKIVIEASLSGDWMNQQIANTSLEDKLEMKYMSTKSVAFKPPWNSVKAKIMAGKVTWIIYSAEPIKAFYIAGVLKMVSPGDSIYMSYQANNPVFAGKGVEKIKLWNQVKEIETKIITPTSANFRITSTDDYLRWDRYAADKVALQMTIIDSSVNKMTQAEHNYLKAEIINTAELDRLNAFENLLSKFRKQKLPGTSLADICTIWDSTQYRDWSKWLRLQTDFNGSMYIISLFNEMEVARKFEFDGKNDSLKSREKRNYLYYTAAKQNYAGLLRERLMAYILVQEVVPKMDAGNAMREWIIKDYYGQPGYPEYKQMVKDLQKRKG